MGSRCCRALDRGDTADMDHLGHSFRHSRWALYVRDGMGQRPGHSVSATSRVWVISWMYGDRSGTGFIRAFDSEERARDLLDLLLKHGGDGKHYCIDPVEIVREFD